MGTQYMVKVVDLPADQTSADLGKDIAHLLHDVDAKMSTYRSDSELSTFNAAKTTQWFPVSYDMIDIVDEAIQVSSSTTGAFDVTVGPLVNLWGFGPEQHPERVPTAHEIQSEMARVGYQHVHIRKEPPALRKDLEGIYIDLSALAKGYAVDKVADYLETLGIADYMVEVGGELRLKGHNGTGIPWKIAIERPSPGIRDIHRIIQLENKGVATSGDYRNYFEKDGRRYSHTIDPRTGRPIDHRLASITVISDTSMHADAMATALMVAGPDEGGRLAQEQKLAAYFITKTADGFTERATEAFQKYLISGE